MSGRLPLIGLDQYLDNNQHAGKLHRCSNNHTKSGLCYTSAEIFAAHKWWTQALLYFLAADPIVNQAQPEFCAQVRTYGLCADEFTDTQGWPPQLYVRESIRLRGATVLTQHDTVGAAAAAGIDGAGRWSSSVGLSSWGIDVHAVKRVVVRSGGRERITNAGGHDTMKCTDSTCPHLTTALVEVPYEALTPRRNDTANLLVPVCASFSHIGFSTFRLEPQYAVFGQSAGLIHCNLFSSASAVVPVH